tara:strand:- start:1396 stop:1803 length:408 start_codon:yes stop_codon:yes gene_type:complete
MAEKKKTKKRIIKKKVNEGVGDKVEKVLKKTGVDKVAKFILGEDCGCEERKQKLNQMFARFTEPECLQEDEYKWLQNWYGEERNIMKQSQQDTFIKIYKRVFRIRGKVSTHCPSCMRDYLGKMKKLFDTYEDDKK